MNKYFNKIVMSAVFILGILGFVSCTDYLDKAPGSSIKPDDAFKNFKNFQGFTEELYNCIPVISASDYHNTWNWGEDEIWETGETRLFAYRVDQGDYWSWDNAGYSWLRTGGDPASQDRFQKGKFWGLSWYAIRKANIGLANLDKLTDATDEQKNLIAGQLYFFRGWFHFMLMQYWGGLPYIDQVLPSDQVLKLPRLNYQATADKVGADLQKAADLLPVDWDQTATGKLTLNNNNIRINKVMAYTFLGKNYLYAGSPLMNSESTGSSTYNIEYCKKAAAAFVNALNICETTKSSDGYPLYSLVPFSRYSEIFYTYNAAGKIPGKVKALTNDSVWRENIFFENLDGANGRWRWNQVNDYRPQNICSGGIKCYPTANYVDYYGMANGLPITDAEKADAESGYDPAYPWKNRDPRFYNDIIYDGLKLSVTTKAEATQYASLYTGGLCRTSNTAAKGCFTGYMETKFLHPLTNDWDGYRENTNFVLSLMRLSDVYLMYAEATAIAYGSQGKAPDYSLTALGAVNKIRDRAGVGHVADKFLASTETFMGELRRERAVELAFEGHRFNDLRRWLLLTEKPYTLKKVVYFDRAKDVTSAVLYANPKNGHVLNFKETVFFERQLGLKHYWFPFLKSDVNMYKEFKQNPGW